MAKYNKSKESKNINRLLLVVAILLYAFIFGVIGVMIGQIPYVRFLADLTIKVFKEAPLESRYSGEFNTLVRTWTDDAAKVHDVFMLIGGHYKTNPALLLMNKDGKILHHWNVANSFTNQEVIKAHGIKDVLDGVYSAIDDAVLFPNGDVVAIQDNRILPNYRGQRLFRMDKASKIQWQIEGTFHHEFDITDKGTIYAMDYELRNNYPLIAEGLYHNTSFLCDRIVEVSPQGKILSTISIPDAFVGTDFAFYLYSFRLDLPEVQDFAFKDGAQGYDLLHTNSVQYLTAKMAMSIPSAQEGDLLLSMRGNSMIAVLRPSTKKIVWATMGAWKHQHDVRVLPDGSIRIFDNEGAALLHGKDEGKAQVELHSRLLDYYPLTNKTAVRFFDPTKPNLTTSWRGFHHEFSDGTLLYLSNNQSSLVQISKEGKVLWELRGVPDREQVGAAHKQKISFAKPYDKDYPKFLGEGEKQ